MNRLQSWLAFVGFSLLAASLPAQVFRLPTANRALFEKGGEERFFAPTPGKPWTSGGFGCVRSDGGQMHEGLDIRSVQHDKRGEPADPVMATADGAVTYLNQRPALSNFGKYVILRHEIEGLPIFSLYAHLSEIRAGLKLGASVRAGETIAIMGRTTNTRSAIGKDRAHVHFELDLLANDRFAEWFGKTHPGERNDHGVWNGHNLFGFDPAQIFLQQKAQGAGFSLRQHLRSQTELCRVLVHDTQFPWLRRYAALMTPNPSLGSQPAAGYELVLDYNGIPFQVIPRAALDFKGQPKYRLLSVNAAWQERNHCRKLVMRHDTNWRLTLQGQSVLDLLTY
ncbi:MAG: peptidoglycan DD-metalloendopeptidase family protein [Verrucomicrobia bacterium]|nr:peptidoglycan DD-metalloendopeptidase family protein [Verrucomicrobiota bacterium]